MSFMKRKIRSNMFFLSLISVLCTVILLMAVFYNLFNMQMKKNIKDKALIIERSLFFEQSSSDRTMDYILALNSINKDERISIISKDGAIIFDSHTETNNSENHMDFPEVNSAYIYGFGEATRYSNSLGEEIYYYAVKLSDNNILRLGVTNNNIYKAFKQAIPLILMVIAAVFFLCNSLAKRLTNKIIKPINTIDLTNEGDFIYDELASFYKTITRQREQIKEQVASIENRSNTINIIIKNMNEGIILLDKSGTILASNRSAINIFDDSNDDFVGKNMLELTRNAEILDAIKTSYDGRRYETVLKLDYRMTQVFISPVLENGRINGTIVLFLDITERFSVEKMRKEFSANVSHELKTPLTTILGLSEMIDNGIAKEGDVKGFAHKIKSEASRLIALIEDIIMLSELDEQTQQKLFEEFDLMDLCLEVVDGLKHIADAKSISIMISGDRVDITANRRMMYEMLLNLIDNAIKYNKLGGNVSVFVYKEIGEVKIRIEDTGIGIPKKHLGRIFERFYRVDKSRSKKTGGTGLGLSIVKHIAQYHKALIEIQSKEGVGTSIDVFIPVKFDD